MAIEIREVQSKSDIKKFVDLQFDLYAGNAFWVPPIKKDEMAALDQGKNPAFNFCDAKFWLAFKDGKCVGRVGAIVNKKYNEKVGKKYGRINRIEFYDDVEVADALFNTAENWIKDQGMELVHGPLGFSNLDTQGLQVEGFDRLPSIASVYHHDYYQTHFDRKGYEKENDWLEFQLKLSEQAVTKANRGAQLIKRRFGFELLEVQSKKDMKQYIPRIFEILNEAFSDLPYVAELDQAMIDTYSKKYFDVLDPYFITLVKKDDDLVGFFIGMPNLSEAMQKAKGKLYPLGFTHVLKAIKNPQIIDMMLTGVLPEHQSSGVAVLLIAELQRRMMERGIDTMETTGVFESNHNVISNWKNYDGDQYKRRRCYVKKLA